MRGGSMLAPSSACKSMMRPRLGLAERPERAGPADTASSTMQFHSAQASQRPCQRWLTAPQFWQTKLDRGFAMCPASLSDEDGLAYPPKENKT